MMWLNIISVIVSLSVIGWIGWMLIPDEDK